MFNKLIHQLTWGFQPYYFLGSIAASVGGSLVSGLFGSSSAKKAAKQSRKGQEAAARAAKEQYEKSEKAFKPYTEAGTRGLAEYERMLGAQADYEDLIKSDIRDPFQFGAEEFQQYKDPGYEFRLAEGERALSRQAGALGKLQSGERAVGLIQYGQQMGSQEFGAARQRAMQDYQSQVSREQQEYERSLGTYGRQYTAPMSGYGGLADIGRSSVSDLARLGAAAAGAQGQAAVGAGEARAAGTLGSAGAWSGALRDIGQQFTGAGGGTFNPPPYSTPTGTMNTGGGFLANLPGRY